MLCWLVGTSPFCVDSSFSQSSVGIPQHAPLHLEPYCFCHNLCTCYVQVDVSRAALGGLRGLGQCCFEEQFTRREDRLNSEKKLDSISEILADLGLEVHPSLQAKQIPILSRVCTYPASWLSTMCQVLSGCQQCNDKLFLKSTFVDGIFERLNNCV